MSWVAIGVSVAGIGASVGMSAAQASAARNAQPNLAASSRELSATQMRLLPLQRQLEAAAQQGGKVTIDNFPAHEETRQFIKVHEGWSLDKKKSLRNIFLGGIPQRKQVYKEVPYVASEWAPGGKYHGRKTDGGAYSRTVQIPEGPKEFDFSGYGQADVQAKLADAQAKLGLDLARKYDAQFIEENLKQQALADPEGVAARAKMNELIQSQLDRNPDRPIADLLDAQVTEALAAAGQQGLSDPDQARLDNAVTEALAQRGGPVTPADFQQPLTTGFAGERREANARQNALGWLASGATPEDTAYRREQQNLSNLSAQVNGRTPQSQFGALSGAHAGPTPMVRGRALPTLPGGTTEAAHGAALNNWRTTQAYEANQVNPWMVGLSSAINFAGAAGNAGWKPLRRN